jgi:hypothetical protein
MWREKNYIVPKELREMFQRAVDAGLTKAQQVEKMSDHVRHGKFSAEYYMKIWGERLANPAGLAKAAPQAVRKEDMQELDTIFTEALRAGLTNLQNIKTMKNNIEVGRFTPGHYMKLWRKRLGEEKDKTRKEASELPGNTNQAG